MLPAPKKGDKSVTEKTFMIRIRKFFIVFGLTLMVVYGLLPLLTGSIGILDRMASSLDENGINPSSYYYTDVEQVIESEHYLRRALDIR